MDYSNENNVAKLRVVGVGGAGGNAINDMIESGINGVEFIAINTDKQDLNRSKTDVRVMLGTGLGAGADPEKGKAAAKESEDRIKEVLQGTDMLFITAGMGGGTGTGAAPVVAQIAREMDILTVAVVTKPFRFEGPAKAKNAEIGVENLKKYVDAIIAIPNEKLLELPNASITLLNAFKEANGVLRIGIKGISDLITNQGHVNLDFADVKSVIQNSGVAMLGFGEGTGEGKVKAATEQALSSPLLEKSIEGARKLLVSITTGKEFGLLEASELFEIVHSRTDNANVNLQWGVVIEPELQDVIKVSIVATDFDDREEKKEIVNHRNNENGKILSEGDKERKIVIPSFSSFFNDDK